MPGPTTGPLTKDDLTGITTVTPFDQLDIGSIALDIEGDTSGATATAEGTTTSTSLTTIDVVITSDASFIDGETLLITETGQTGQATATASI